MSQKKILRQNFLEKRRKISGDDKKKFSQKICTTLEVFFKENEEKFPGYIALFAGMEDEVDVLPLLRKIGKKFCFPNVIDAKNGIMEFFAVENFADLELGTYKILEPKNTCIKISPEKISCICIPAVSIDMHGNRIGMGGGFYDRYLARCDEAVEKIGVIFDTQKSEEIFCGEEFDIPVSKICTEKILQNFV